MDRPDWSPEGVQVDRPSAARIYDFLLGGSHNFAIDRAVAEQAVAAVPDLAIQARANRAFMNRAVRYLLSQGIRQFLDLGSGIPTTGNVHEVAQREVPEARVVYVDIDPVAVLHAQHILAGNDRATAVQADLRHPLDIMADARIRGVLDLDQPVAVLLVAVLHSIPDADDPFTAVEQLKRAMTAGSYLIVGHAAQQHRPEADSLVEISKQTTTPLSLRTAEEIAHFFDGLELVEPGLVWTSAWRPEHPVDAPERSGNLAGVGRKP